MLEILLTQMRREGFEMTVSPPKVLYQQDKDGKIDGESIVQGEGYIVTDRNSLLEKLKNMDK